MCRQAVLWLMWAPSRSHRIQILSSFTAFRASLRMRADASTYSRERRFHRRRHCSILRVKGTRVGFISHLLKNRASFPLTQVVRVGPENSTDKMHQLTDYYVFRTRKHYLGTHGPTPHS